ncbi:hypothetical protein FA13DRAFT_1652183, partial [Coprinellus micaceus]
MFNGEPVPLIVNEWQDAVSPPEDSAHNLHFSDSDEEGGHEDADPGLNVDDANPLDYSQQMSELFNDDANEPENESTSSILDNVFESDHEEEDEDEEFVYTGMDSSKVPLAYREQLRDVLGQEHEEDSVGYPQGVEGSLLNEE